MKYFVADFADFVAEFVAGTTKPLDNQGVLRVLGRCGRNLKHLFSSGLLWLISFCNVLIIGVKRQIKIKRTKRE
jgi:hypothetical protein